MANYYARYEELLGKVFTEFEWDSESFIKFRGEGIKFLMQAREDCCNDMYLESHDGDLEWLLNSPITQAEEVTNIAEPDLPVAVQDSYTWTFIKLGTVKGSVTFRWFGTSNGYYAECPWVAINDRRVDW